MVHSIDAIYDDGALRRLSVASPNGTRVYPRIEEEDGGPPIVFSNCEDYDTWLDGVAGRWQGDFLRGDEGNLNT